MVTKQQMTLARDVMNATRELNEAIRDAKRGGLRVDTTLHTGWWGDLTTWVQSVVSFPLQSTADKPTHDWENKDSRATRGQT